VAAVLAALAAPVVGAEANPVSTDNATVTLVPERMSVQPGGTVTVGLHQDIREGWHTYWLNPGDSGEATRIDWRLPEEASAGDIIWPAPRRIPYGPLTNYGYSDEVLLLSELSVPADWPVGEPLAVEAHATWLICSDVCIPEEATLTLELPVSAEPGLANALWSSEFAEARAAVPAESPWPADYARAEDGIALRLAGAELDPGTVRDVYFFPYDWGVIDHAAPQPWRVEGGDLVLGMTQGMAPPQDDRPLEGVLTLVEGLDQGPVRHAFALDARPAGEAIAMPAGASAGPAGASAAGGVTFPAAVGLALLGGLILNLMPCVFPVLSMKAMALVGQAHGEARHALLGGLAYTAGILASFAAVAGALIALQAGGAQIGWGFQLQSPMFVAVLAYILFAVGLSLSGVFTVGGSLAGAGSSLAGRGGPSGSFFTGVLATVVATPCTAPFMGAAIGFALAQPWAVSLAVFLALGLGLALPYLLLSLRPGLLRFLPRPGPWMDRLKQFLAFPMYASAAWLVWVLSLQAGPDAVLAALGGMLAIAFAAWVWDATRDSARGWRLSGVGLAAGMAIAALALARGEVGLSGESRAAPSERPAAAESERWERFSQARLAELRAEGRPVFVNVTAAWCITCLVNERIALSSDRVTEGMRDAGIVYLKGDWTNRDEEITRYLRSFGRSGVPLYVYYPASPEAEPRVLPQILTEAQVMDVFRSG
jgi:thiol:disulfide interchange protein DsbD